MIDRRAFMTAAATSLVSASIAARAQPAASSPAPGAGVRVRREASSPAAAADLAKYRNAVSQLMALPTSDKRSWVNLAKQHNEHCPHQNWWFLPWHRAYLFYFERACQDVLGDKTFSLPYWDWTRNPRIPGPFWSGSLAGNGLTPTVTRGIAPNEDLDSELVGRRVIDGFMRNSQAQAAYSSAPRPTPDLDQRSHGTYGYLEGTPHNSVHNLVSGTMVTMMSPLDPIFWLHHGNIDRLWASWYAAYKTAPTDALWQGMQLGEFYDAQGKLTVKELTSKTVTLLPYGYEYDRLETRSSDPSSLVFQDSARMLASLKLPQLLKLHGLESPMLASLKINGATTSSIKTDAAFDSLIALNSSATAPASITPVNLVLEGVRVPPAARTFLRVFLNCEKPSLRTPTDDPSYVGSISTFAQDHGHGGAANSGELSFSLDATETLTRLVGRGGYKPGVVYVSLVAVGPDPKAAGTVIKPGRVTLVPLGT